MPTVENDNANINPLRVTQALPGNNYQNVSYSTLSIEAITQVAVQNYGLDESMKCVLFQRGMNDTYRLSTREAQYALRVARSNVRSRAALLGELTAIRHVGSKGIAVALPVARADGDWITNMRAPEGLREAVTFHWATGRAPKYTDPAHALHYGQSVARLHNASDDLKADPARPRMDSQYLLEIPAEFIRSRLAWLPSGIKAFDALVDRVQARLSHAQTRLRDWGFCHGDLHANNARIEGSHLVLFDFDCCGSGWRIYDIASYRWAARQQGVEDAAWRPFIEGYLQRRPAAAASLEFVWLFMILRHLWMTAQCIVLSAEMGVGFVPDDAIEAIVPFCESIEADADARSNRDTRRKVTSNGRQRR